MAQGGPEPDAEEPEFRERPEAVETGPGEGDVQNGDGAQETYTVTMTDPVTMVQTPYEIPRMDLSDRPITVTYDRETKAWPASYVSLFYPAALSMELGQNASVTAGTVPPKWAVPSDARHSVLIEKLNVTSSKEASKYAWPLGQAFSDPPRGTRRRRRRCVRRDAK